MPILPSPLFATTDRAAPYKMGEPISADNPLQVTGDLDADFSIGEPVSPTNPLPVTLDLESPYKVGEPISQDNPLPATLSEGPTAPGEGFGVVFRARLLAGTYLLDVTGMSSGGSDPVVPPIVPSLVSASYNDQPEAFMGFATQPSAGRWNMTGATEFIDGAMFAYRIKGTSARMSCFGGDTTPYRVLVDSENFAAFNTPTLSAGKITLFTGLADTWHTVFIWADNSPTGQGFVAPSATLIEADEIAPMGQIWRLGDAAFPGVSACLRNANIYYPLSTNLVVGRSALTGYGNTGQSIHMRAKFDSLWVYCNKTTTAVSVSINGALATVTSLSALDTGTQTTGGWRKINLPAQVSYADFIITGAGAAPPSVVTGQPIQGIMAVGDGANMIAPTNTAKRHVCMMGASQVEGVAAGGAGAFINDLAMVQNRLPIFGVSCGLAGSTITTLTAAVPAIAARLEVRDIAMLSVGINSTDNAQLTIDYTALIQACLDNGFTKVIARGLVQASSNDSKNAKIASAVASFGSGAVVYADVSTWGLATVGGAGGTIAMPDGSHPSAAGYQTMADFWVRDHAGLFVGETVTITSSDGDPSSLRDNGDGTFDVIVNAVNVGTITQAQIDAEGWITVVEPVTGMSGNNVVLTTTGHVIYVGDVAIETDVQVIADVAAVGNALPFDASAYPDAAMTARFSYSIGADTLVIDTLARAAPLKLIQFRDSNMDFTNSWPAPLRSRQMTLALRITGNFSQIDDPGFHIGRVSLSGVSISNNRFTAARTANFQSSSPSPFTTYAPDFGFPPSTGEAVSIFAAVDYDGGLPGGEKFVVWLSRNGGPWARLGGHTTGPADARIVHMNQFGSQNSGQVGGVFDLVNHLWASNVALDPATNWMNFFEANGDVKDLGASGIVEAVTPVLYIVGNDFSTGNNRGSGGGTFTRARTPVNVVNL